MLKISERRYYKDIKSLAAQIKKKGVKYKAILAVSRGGTIVGTYLSHILNIPMGVIATKSYDEDNKQRQIKVSSIAMIDIPNYNDVQKWLLVEDLVDSGKTIKAIKSKLPQIKFEVAALYHKSKCRAPKFFVDKFDAKEWISFPYEE